MIQIIPPVASLLLWSTCRIQHKGVTHLFVAAKGNVGQGMMEPLTIADTNSIMGSLCFLGIRLIIEAVGWEVWGSVEDRAACFRHASWAWESLTSIIDGSPLGVPPQMIPPTNKEADKEYPQIKDLPVSRGIVTLSVPKVLEPYLRTSLRLDLNANLQSPVDVRFTLYGTYEYVVQEVETTP